MKTPWHFNPRLVAIVGGSGAGKSWLAARLQSRLGKESALLRLDDFYRDRSHLPLRRREQINFDHPRSIDWPAFERVLLGCRAGLPLQIPRYDFARHTRCAELEWWRPKRIILVEGLWLLHRPALRRLFGLSIFVECPEALQFRRRMRRDAAERGRGEESVQEQFQRRVLPMAVRHVQPQARWADLVVTSPVRGNVLDRLAARIERL
jgi:uridine kinase